jgi:hypothetical protein
MEGTYKKEKGSSSTSNIKKCTGYLGGNLKLSVHNKLLLYKQVLNPSGRMASRFEGGGVQPQAT